jgi:hypothetical protein
MSLQNTYPVTIINNNNRFVCYPKNKNYETWFEIFFNEDNYKEKFKELGEPILELISNFITLNVENSLAIDDIIFLRLIRSETIIPSPATFNSLDL